MLATKQLLVPIDFHSMEKKYYRSQWVPENIWLHILQNIFFWVPDKTETHPGLKQVED